MAYTRSTVLTLEDFAKLPTSTVWGAIDEAYNAGTNPFRAAGVLTNSPLIGNALTSGTGIRTEVQAWNDLEYVESNVGNTDPTDHATPQKMTTKLWDAVRTHRAHGVSSMNLVKDMTGQDALSVLTSRVANYQNSDEVAHLFAVLNGLIAGDATAKKYTYQMEDELSLAELLKGAQATKLDNDEIVSVIGLNSANYLKFQLANLIETVPGSDANVTFKAIGGDRFRLVRDERFGNNIVGMGAGLFHFATAPQDYKSVEVESDASSGKGTGQETAWFRFKRIVHPMGFKFSGSFESEGGPTHAELSTAGAYTAATDVKKIPLVVFKPAA